MYLSLSIEREERWPQLKFLSIRDLILFLGRDALYDDLSQYSREKSTLEKLE